MSEGSWWVDQSGTQLLLRYAFAGNLQPSAVSTVGTYAEAHAGDPAGAVLNGRNRDIKSGDTRPFAEFARETRAR